MADAEWMYADVATGAVGFQALARFNPLRWSGVKSVGATIVDMEHVVEDKAKGAENRARPVILKCPGGVTGKEQHYDSLDEALKYLRSRAGLTVEWMWGDAATGVLGVEQLAKFNSFRWSATKTIPETIADLEELLKNPAEAPRPVVFKIPAGVLSPETRSDTVQQAIDQMKRVKTLIGHRWATDQSLTIGGRGEEAKFKDKLTLLEKQTSVIGAVDALNKGTTNGKDALLDDACARGICVIYSNSMESYVLLWRGDTRDQALAVVHIKLERKVDWRHASRGGQGEEKYRFGDFTKSILQAMPGAGDMSGATIAEKFNNERFIMLQSGEIRARYDVKEVLGAGVGGEVSLIDRKHTGQRYVFKDAGEKLDEIQREFKAMSVLRHPNLVKLVEFITEQKEDGDRAYTIAEFAHGGDLKKYMESVAGVGDRLEEASIRHIFRQAVLGTAYMHSQNYVHNDLKPDNLLVIERYVQGGVNAMPRVVITDFGCSALKGWTGSLGDPRYAGPVMMEEYGEMFRTGGIRQFWAPEVDTWSLGATLFELLSSKQGAAGVIPFIYKTASAFPARELGQENKFREHQALILSDRAYPVKVREHCTEGVSEPAITLVSKLLAKESIYRSDISGILSDIDNIWLRDRRSSEKVMQTTFRTEPDEDCQIMMNAVMWRMEFDENMQSVREAFERFNVSQTGRISNEEFLSRFANKELAQKVFVMADIVGDGYLEFNEFATISYDWDKLSSDKPSDKPAPEGRWCYNTWYSWWSAYKPITDLQQELRGARDKAVLVELQGQRSMEFADRNGAITWLEASNVNNDGNGSGDKLKLLLQELLLDITGTKAGIKKFLGTDSDRRVDALFERMDVRGSELTADIFLRFIKEKRDYELEITSMN